MSEFHEFRLFSFSHDTEDKFIHLSILSFITENFDRSLFKFEKDLMLIRFDLCFMNFEWKL